MGCDIHPRIARRTGEGELVSFMHGTLDLGRDYVMFGLMAGVRGKEKLFEPRGLPDDVPFSYKFDHDRLDGDAHSASWLTTQEVRMVADAYPEVAERLDGKRRQNPWLAALVGLMEAVDRWSDEYDPDGGAVLIFWFDN